MKIILKEKLIVGLHCTYIHTKRGKKGGKKKKRTQKQYELIVQSHNFSPSVPVSEDDEGRPDLRAVM